jgi:hypothetical protein
MNFLFLLFALPALAAPPQILESGQEGHGGDIAVAQFIEHSDKLISDLSRLPSNDLPSPLFIQEYERAARLTKISSTDSPITIDGIEVDAVNFPDVDNPRIILNRNRWLDPRPSFVWRRLLVLHEYLSIMGYRDSRYEISRPLIIKIYEKPIYF